MISDKTSLKTVDIHSQSKSLKMAWIYRISNNTGWADIAQMYFENIGGIYFILRCFYDTKCLPDMPKFYHDILNYAQEIFLHPKCKCILWNNRLIKVENKSLFLKNWYEKGIVYIHDLLNEEGTWLSYDQFQNKFKIRTNFLRYLGIVNSAKTAYANNPDIQALVREARPNINFNSDIFLLKDGNFLNIKKAKSKDFYQYFMNNKVEPPTSLSRWLQKFSVANEIVMNSMNLCRRSTKEPQLIAFQFKIIHNIVNCASNLKKWGIRDSNVCFYCKKRNIDIDDTLVHALVDCQTTQEWLQSIYIEINSPTIQNLCRDEFLFGVHDQADNMLCIIIKKQICDIRGQEKDFFIETFLKKLYLSIVAEKNMLRERQFSLKWSNYCVLVRNSCNYFKNYQ